MGKNSQISLPEGGSTMSIKADFHMHSHHSGDSDANMEDMIRRAISLGLKQICFTEHYDPDFIYQDGEAHIFELNTDSYLYELIGLKNKYQDRIKVLFGVELGLQSHLKREHAIYSKSFDFDFIIGSSHLCERRDPYYPAFFEGRSEEEAHHAYFTGILENVKKLPYFDVYGHLDYVLRYGPTKNAAFTYEKHKDVLDAILMHLIEEEKGIELNTAGFDRGFSEPNPYLSVLQRYHELGGEIITIGSDAHDATHIANHFDKAEEILKSCGFKYYCIFENRVPEYLKL